MPGSRVVAQLAEIVRRATKLASGTAPSDDDKPSTYTPPKFPTGLAPGKAKPSARTLQRALKAAGYMSKSVREADNYGPQTQAAVVKFHNAHPQYRAAGVTRDPAIGPKGWAAMFRLAYGK
ncbi:peptidoglycan-binding protein [Streptomyces sp. NBC_00445]|uniref:peptidoglycan-binding domain-containing protein n=1 Tax=Streptomyces sp. NBC_00445 TaxID=2975745 RepID=UPI002E22103A